MKRQAWLAACGLALAGCGLFDRSAGSTLPPAEDTPAHRACRAEAKSSPEVRALDRERNPNNVYNTDRLEREQASAEIRAYRKCLLAQGLTLPGGVEPQVRR